MVLNQMAGRHWGNRAFHAVVPWVLDMSCAVEGTMNVPVAQDEDAEEEEEAALGWRNLRKSKWRLNKGDEQLDFTYASADTPHHISDDCLSELAVCMYKVCFGEGPGRSPASSLCCLFSLVFRNFSVCVRNPNRYCV
jgi:WD repeat-containing protein 81